MAETGGTAAGAEAVQEVVSDVQDVYSVHELVRGAGGFPCKVIVRCMRRLILPQVMLLYAAVGGWGIVIGDMATGKRHCSLHLALPALLAQWARNAR